MHFYSSSHLTAVTALKQIDGEFESVPASLKCAVLQDVLARHRARVPAVDPRHRPLLFRQCDETISAVFLYSPKTTLASISILQLDEAGAIGSAAAMATLIVLTSAVVTGLLFAVEWWLIRRTQSWRNTARP